MELTSEQKKEIQEQQAQSNSTKRGGQNVEKIEINDRLFLSFSIKENLQLLNEENIAYRQVEFVILLQVRRLN
jgi:hypothetical protein